MTISNAHTRITPNSLIPDLTTYKLRCAPLIHVEWKDARTLLLDQARDGASVTFRRTGTYQKITARFPAEAECPAFTATVSKGPGKSPFDVLIEYNPLRTINRLRGGTDGILDRERNYIPSSRLGTDNSWVWRELPVHLRLMKARVLAVLQIFLALPLRHLATTLHAVEVSHDVGTKSPETLQAALRMPILRFVQPFVGLYHRGSHTKEGLRDNAPYFGGRMREGEWLKSYIKPHNRIRLEVSLDHKALQGILAATRSTPRRELTTDEAVVGKFAQVALYVAPIIQAVLDDRLIGPEPVTSECVQFVMTVARLGGTPQRSQELLRVLIHQQSFRNTDRQYPIDRLRSAGIVEQVRRGDYRVTRRFRPIVEALHTHWLARFQSRLLP